MRVHQAGLHPNTEMRVWEYAFGKPKETIEMSTAVKFDERLAAEREQLRMTLSVDLVAESEADSSRARSSALQKPAASSSDYASRRIGVAVRNGGDAGASERFTDRVADSGCATIRRGDGDRRTARRFCGAERVCERCLR